MQKRKNIQKSMKTYVRTSVTFIATLVDDLSFNKNRWKSEEDEERLDEKCDIKTKGIP